MRRKSTQGFTLIELLIVIAIIGILAAVLIPNLLNARVAAQKRAAEAYAQNVYTAAFAYVSEDPSNTVITDSACETGYTAGAYSTPNPGSAVASCAVTDTNSDDNPEVVVTTDAGGTTTTFSLP